MHGGDAFREYEHPKVARVHQKMGLVVENAVADADADAQMVGRQRPKFRKHQPRQHVEGIDRGPEQRIERELGC
jgi:hypothetical protein